MPPRWRPAEGRDRRASRRGTSPTRRRRRRGPRRWPGTPGAPSRRVRPPPARKAASSPRPAPRSEQPGSLHLRGLLQFEKELLALQPAGETGQPPVAADHPMAGHDDRERIAAHRLAHGLSEPLVAQSLRDLAIGRGLPERDLPEHPPDPLLELIATGGGRQIELGPPPVEVLPQLVPHRLHHRIA